jgi:hypothetical protein
MEEVIRSEVRPQVQRDVSILFNMFQGLGEEEVSPRGTWLPIGVGYNESNAWMVEGGDLPVPGTDIQKRMRVDYVRYAKGFEFTGDFLYLQKSKANLMRGLQKRFQAYTDDIKVEMGQQLWLDGTGKKGVVANNAIAGSLASAGVVAGTGTPGAAVATGANGWVRLGVMPDEGWTYGAQQVGERMRMNITSPAGTVRQGTGAGTAGNRSLCIVSSVNQATGQVFFDQVPTDAAIGDLLVFEGSYGNAITGMEKHIANDAGTYQGLSRATYPQLQSIVYDAANAPLTYGLMVFISNAAVFRRDNASNDPGQAMVVTSPNQYSVAESYFEGRKRATNDEDTLRVGMENLVVRGVPWRQDRWCQEDSAWFIQKRAFIRLELKELGMIDDDGRTLRMKTSTTGGLRKWAVSGWFGWMGNLGGLEPRASARIKRLDVTAGIRGYQYAV